MTEKDYIDGKIKEMTSEMLELIPEMVKGMVQIEEAFREQVKEGLTPDNHWKLVEYLSEYPSALSLMTAFNGSLAILLRAREDLAEMDAVRKAGVTAEYNDCEPQGEKGGEFLTCQDCGVSDSSVEEGACPYSEEIYGALEPVCLCTDCHNNRADDI